MVSTVNESAQTLSVLAMVRSYCIDMYMYFFFSSLQTFLPIIHVHVIVNFDLENNNNNVLCKAWKKGEIPVYSLDK